MEPMNKWYGGRLMDLASHECTELLRAVRVGRVAWCTPEGPVVIPVNFVFHEGAVWIRSTPYSALARGAGLSSDVMHQMAFEVDGVDEMTQSGWSVLARGHATWHAVSDLPADLPQLDPWPEGVRTLVVSIDIRELSGKRLLPS